MNTSQANELTVAETCDEQSRNELYNDSPVGVASTALRFAPDTRVLKLAENHWQFVTTTSALTIKCPEALLTDLVNTLGTRSTDAVVASLADRYPEAALRTLVRTLSDNRILTTATSVAVAGLRDSIERYLNIMPQVGGASQDYSHAVPNIYLNGSGILRDETERLAVEVGYAVLTDADLEGGKLPSLIIALADVPSHQTFRVINRDLVIGKSVPAIFAYIDEAVSRLFRVIPGATSCFECLHHRIRSSKAFTREFDAAYSGENVWFDAKNTTPLIQARQLSSAVISQASSVLARRCDDLYRNSVIEYHAVNATVTQSPILKLPRCPACGLGKASALQSGPYDLRRQNVGT